MENGVGTGRKYGANKREGGGRWDGLMKLTRLKTSDVLPLILLSNTLRQLPYSSPGRGRLQQCARTRLGSGPGLLLAVRSRASIQPLRSYLVLTSSSFLPAWRVVPFMHIPIELHLFTASRRGQDSPL